MRRLSALVALLALGLMAAMPVVADDAQECPHHEATIESLRNCVVHAWEGGYITDPEVAQGLLDKVDAAQLAADRGKFATAANILEAVIQEVSAQAVKSIELTHAEHMIHHTEMVIDALVSP